MASAASEGRRTAWVDHKSSEVSWEDHRMSVALLVPCSFAAEASEVACMSASEAHKSFGALELMLDNSAAWEVHMKALGVHRMVWGQGHHRLAFAA